MVSSWLGYQIQMTGLGYDLEEEKGDILLFC